MRTVTVDGYHEANRTLSLPELKQSLYDEGAVLMDRVLVALHGEEHRKRRILEMRIFKKDFFSYYETEVLPQVISQTLARYRARGGADLMEFGAYTMIDLTADFAGIDRPLGTDEERADLVRLLRGMSAAATLGQFTGDREAVRESIRATIVEFDERYFTPSAARRRELLARLEAGDLTEDQLPRDILTVLLRGGERADLSRDMMVRETAFFYLAGAHTSIHSLTHAMHEIFTWMEKHPEDRERIHTDPLFLQRCIHESFRLHPSSPIVQRRALSEVALPSGETAAEGDTVVIDLYAANRQPAVFGADAVEFNPRRQLPAIQPPYGLTFGVGIHTCLGRELAAGVVAKENTDPASHQYGTVTALARGLLGAGARPDPAKPAERDLRIAREAWAKYPVLLNS